MLSRIPVCVLSWVRVCGAALGKEAVPDYLQCAACPVEPEGVEQEK